MKEYSIITVTVDVLPIVDFYRNYLLTTFQTTDDKYNSQLEAELRKDGVISNGPYVSVSDSYEKEKTISELVDEGN